MLTLKQGALIVAAFVAGFGADEAIIRSANLDRVTHDGYIKLDELKRSYTPTVDVQQNFTPNTTVKAKYTANDIVQRDFVLRSLCGGADMPRRIVPAEWHYKVMPGRGADVATFLSDVRPLPQNVVVTSDAAHDTFNIWYHGQGANVRYTYRYGSPSELADPPQSNFFFNDRAIVPAGIGSAGGLAVPIYFVVSRR